MRTEHQELFFKAVKTTLQQTPKRRKLIQLLMLSRGARSANLFLKAVTTSLQRGAKKGGTHTTKRSLRGFPR